MKLEFVRPLLPFEARHYGISWFYSIGQKANPSAGRELIFTNKLAFTGKIDELAIIRRYNLGNHIRQVSNAVRFAELHNIPAVRLPAGSLFSAGRVGNIALLDSATASSEGTTRLSGDFFYFEKLGITLDRLHRGRTIAALRPNVRLLQGSPQMKKLGIHLRSGDTFAARPHPLYMPPPLRFFLDAIDRSGTAQRGGVHLVCQDLHHPYVDLLNEYCSSRGIECQVSSSSLEDDFRSLASFEELCLSQGTLALAASWLSKHCRKIFAFTRDDGELLTTTELGIRVEHAVSQRDLGPWTGTQQQLSLLSDPSKSRLNWESI